MSCVFDRILYFITTFGIAHLVHLPPHNFHKFLGSVCRKSNSTFLDNSRPLGSCEKLHIFPLGRMLPHEYSFPCKGVCIYLSLRLKDLSPVFEKQFMRIHPHVLLAILGSMYTAEIACIKRTTFVHTSIFVSRAKKADHRSR